MDVQAILRQKYPLLLVDKVLEINYKKSAKGLKNVSMNEPWVQGHFPDKSIYPGVFIIESMAQVGGLAFYNEAEINGYIIGVDKVKFLKKIVPGDTLIIEATITQYIGKLARASCLVRVGDEIAASGVISYAFE